MKAVCEHCGLPFSVGRVAPGRAMYCCSGCALASRLTTDARGTRSVSTALVTVLGVGFVFFNQVLGWLLAVALARGSGAGGEGDVVNAVRLARASLAVGLVVWLALAFSQVRAGAWRGWDLVALVATAGLVVWAVANRQPALAVVGNAALAAWALRGVVRKRAA